MSQAFRAPAADNGMHLILFVIDIDREYFRGVLGSCKADPE
ncbi:MAG: hypothetical protein ABJZ69_07795 [Hyphomicrobiales bacterium]